MTATSIHSLPRRIAQPLRGWACFVVLILICASARTQTSKIQRQRDAFRAAYAAAYDGQDWRPLARGLEDYPLYPYLEATALERDIAHADHEAVRAYLARYPDLIPADDL